MFTGSNMDKMKQSLSKMKILSWNICGAGRKGFKNQLKDRMKFYNLGIIIVMKTKVDSCKAQLIIKSLKMAIRLKSHLKFFSVGVWLLWDNSADFSIKAICTNNRFIRCSIQDNIKTVSWMKPLSMTILTTTYKNN